MYTVPEANTGIAASLRIVNASAVNRTVSVYVYPLGGATEVYAVKDQILPVGAGMDAFCGIPLVLEASDELAVITTGADVCFYLSYLELDRN